MANVKISELTQVETLSTTDVLPVVNDGETKKVTVQQIVDVVPTSGIKDINTVTLDSATAGATAIKINKENLGNNFELKHVEFSARFLVDTSTITSSTITLRFYTDAGYRVVCYKTGIAKKHCIEILGVIDFINGISSSNTNYSANDNPNSQLGTTGTGTVNCLSTMTSTPIKDITFTVLDGSRSIPLLEGSFVSIRGY